jgi:hypothetical protein
LADGRHEPYTFTAKRFTFAYTRDRWNWIARSWTFTPWPWKALLVRIVAMLTRMIERGSRVREAEVVYGYVNANGNEPEPGRPEGGRWKNYTRSQRHAGTTSTRTPSKGGTGTGNLWQGANCSRRRRCRDGGGAYWWLAMAMPHDRIARS